VGSEVFEGELL